MLKRDADSGNKVTRVAAVTRQRSGQNQLEDLLRRVIATGSETGLLQQLVREPQSRPPTVVNPAVPTALEHMLRPFLDGQRQRQRPPPRQWPTRRDWTELEWGISVPATRMADRKDVGGFAMIPPRVTTDRQWAENDGWSRRAGPPLGSVIMLGPGTQEGEQCEHWLGYAKTGRTAYSVAELEYSTWWWWISGEIWTCGDM